MCQIWTLSNTKDILAIISTPVTISFAYLGLRVWKNQIKGKDRYEASKRLLKTVLRLRDAIKIVRNNFITSGEMSEAIKAHDLKIELNSFRWSKEDREMVNRAVYSSRWKSISDVYVDFEVERIEAEVIFPKELQALLQKFTSHITELNVSLDMLLNHDDGAEQEFRKKLRKVVYTQHGENKEADQFYNEVEKSLENISNYLRPYITL